MCCLLVDSELGHWSTKKYKLANRKGELYYTLILCLYTDIYFERFRVQITFDQSCYAEKAASKTSHLFGAEAKSTLLTSFVKIFLSRMKLCEMETETYCSFFKCCFFWQDDATFSITIVCVIGYFLRIAYQHINSEYSISIPKRMALCVDRIDCNSNHLLANGTSDVSCDGRSFIRTCRGCMYAGWVKNSKLAFLPNNAKMAFAKVSACKSQL